MEKVINPLKTVFLYSKEFPKGEMFNLSEKALQEKLDNGWFDTPAHLDLPEEMDTGIPMEKAENANPEDLKALLESYGFIVMTPEQLKAEANKMAEVALSIEKFTDEALITEAERRGLKDSDNPEPFEFDEIAAQFEENPKSLTKKQLVEYGNTVFTLGLRENMKEDTLIEKIIAAKDGE